MTVGIIGLGTFLPAEMWTNDWWPKHVVDGWQEMFGRPTGATSSGPLPPAAQRTLDAMREYATDPFRGARERQVMAADMTTTEMETNAAREALDAAKLRPDDIDVILSETPVPSSCSSTARASPTSCSACRGAASRSRRSRRATRSRSMSRSPRR